jgi:biotin carboxylase
MTTIMILGAGVMQIPGIRLARRSGWRVIVVDGNPEAPGKALADRFEVVDLKDREGLVAIAKRCKESVGLDGVFTAGTDFSASVAWVAEKMGLPGIPFETAMRATDKCLMREAFQRAGVPSPRFLCWAGDSDPRAIPDTMRFPLVVKPVDNMGARGVRRVDDGEALYDACRSALPLSRSSRVIVEEFMDGPELSLDAVVYRGEATVCGIADRHIRFPPSFVEMGHTMPTCLDAVTTARVEEVFKAGIRAIGIDNGAAKGDVKLTLKGPMIGEIAARLSGGYMSGWTFPLSSGVEVTQAALNIAVGLAPGNLHTRVSRVVAERAFISIPGRVQRIMGTADAKAMPQVAEVFVRAGPGDTVVFPRNNVEKCGNVITVGATRDDAERAARAALRRIFILLQPMNEVTTSFLFQGSGSNAFEISDREVIRDLEAMPPFHGDPRSSRPSDPLLVRRFAGFEDLPIRDWHGLPPQEAVRIALDGTARLVDDPDSEGGLVLAGVFWKAVMRGSGQGGRYLLESVREAIRSRSLDRFLAQL